MNDKGIINIEPDDSCVHNGSTKHDAIEIIDDDVCEMSNSTTSSGDFPLDSQSLQIRKQSTESASSMRELTSYQPECIKHLPNMINSSNAKKVLHNPLLQNYYDPSLACRAGWFVEFNWLQYDRRNNELSCMFCSKTTSNGSLAVGRDPLKTRRIDLTVHCQTDTHIQITDHFISGKDTSSDVITVQSNSKFCNMRKILLKKKDNEGVILQATSNTSMAQGTGSKQNAVDNTIITQVSETPTNSLASLVSLVSANTTRPEVEKYNSHVFSHKSSSYQPQKQAEGNGNGEISNSGNKEKIVTTVNYTIPQVLSKEVIEKIVEEDGHRKRVDNYMTHYKVRLNWFKEFEWLEFKTCNNRFFCKYCRLHNTSSIFARGKFAMASRSKRNDFIIHMETDMHKNVMIASGLEQKLGNSATICMNPRHNYKDFVDQIDLNISSRPLTHEQSNTPNQVTSNKPLKSLHNMVHDGSYIAGAPVMNSSTNQSPSDFQPSSTINETVIIKTENKSRKKKRTSSSVIVIEPDEETETEVRSDYNAVDQNELSSKTSQLEDYFDISLSNYLAGKTDECNVKSLELGSPDVDSSLSGFNNESVSNPESNQEKVETSICLDYLKNDQCDNVCPDSSQTCSPVNGSAKMIDTFTGSSESPSESLTELNGLCLTGKVTNENEIVESKDSEKNKQGGTTSLNHSKPTCNYDESVSKLKEKSSSYKFVKASSSDLVAGNSNGVECVSVAKEEPVCCDNTVTESSAVDNKPTYAVIGTVEQVNKTCNISKERMNPKKIPEHRQSNRNMHVSSCDSNDSSGALNLHNVVSNPDLRPHNDGTSSQSDSNRSCSTNNNTISSDFINYGGQGDKKYVPFHDSFWTVANMLRQEKILCDITLAAFTHTGALVKFPSHQLILFCASEYLKKKITGRSSGTKKTFVFPNITASGLKGVLDFLYGQNVIGNVQHYKECYHAAQVLGVSSAQTVFKSLISSHSSSEELVEVILGLPSAMISQNENAQDKEKIKNQQGVAKNDKANLDTAINDSKATNTAVGNKLTDSDSRENSVKLLHRCNKRARSNSTDDQDSKCATEPELKKLVTEYRFCSRNTDSYFPQCNSSSNGASFSDRHRTIGEKSSLTKIINFKCYICRKKGQRIVMNIGCTKPWNTQSKTRHSIKPKNTGDFVYGKVTYSVNRCRECTRKFLYARRDQSQFKKKHKYKS